MTLNTFMGENPSNPAVEDRDHYGYVPWKSGGSHFKGAQSALSALTLLAFLFFLNILQSCLRDQLQAQAPITIWMTQTTSTGTKKVKREAFELEIFSKGDPATNKAIKKAITNNRNQGALIKHPLTK